MLGVFTLHTLNADSFPYPIQQTLIVNTVIEATSARDERGEKTQPYNSEENIFFPQQTSQVLFKVTLKPKKCDLMFFIYLL